MKDNLDENVQKNVHVPKFVHKEVKHMAIKNTRKSTDKRVFKKTAGVTKKVNISPKVMRGGTRL